MKKYSRPVIKAETVDDIGEAIFLDSGWRSSDCYSVMLKGTQLMELGKPTLNVQVDGKHIADVLAGYEWYDDDSEHGHHNHHQLAIFTWNAPLDSNIGISITPGTDFTWNSDHSQCRVLLDYHQNGGDNIGNGSFQVTFTGLPQSVIDAIASDWYAMVDYYPTGFDLYDIGYRNCEHGNWNG